MEKSKLRMSADSLSYYKMTKSKSSLKNPKQFVSFVHGNSSDEDSDESSSDVILSTPIKRVRHDKKSHPESESDTVTRMTPNSKITVTPKTRLTPTRIFQLAKEGWNSDSSKDSSTRSSLKPSKADTTKQTRQRFFMDEDSSDSASSDLQESDDDDEPVLKMKKNISPAEPSKAHKSKKLRSNLKIEKSPHKSNEDEDSLNVSREIEEQSANRSKRQSQATTSRKRTSKGKLSKTDSASPQKASTSISEALQENDGEKQLETVITSKRPESKKSQSKKSSIDDTITNVISEYSKQVNGHASPKIDKSRRRRKSSIEKIDPSSGSPTKKKEVPSVSRRTPTEKQTHAQRGRPRTKTHNDDPNEISNNGTTVDMKSPSSRKTPNVSKNSSPTSTKLQTPVSTRTSRSAVKNKDADSRRNLANQANQFSPRKTPGKSIQSSSESKYANEDDGVFSGSISPKSRTASKSVVPFDLNRSPYGKTSASRSAKSFISPDTKSTKHTVSENLASNVHTSSGSKSRTPNRRVPSEIPNSLETANGKQNLQSPTKIGPTPRKRVVENVANTTPLSSNHDGNLRAEKTALKRKSSNASMISSKRNRTSSSAYSRTQPTDHGNDYIEIQRDPTQVLERGDIGNPVNPPMLNSISLTSFSVPAEVMSRFNPFTASSEEPLRARTLMFDEGYRLTWLHLLPDCIFNLRTNSSTTIFLMKGSIEIQSKKLSNVIHLNETSRTVDLDEGLLCLLKSVGEETAIFEVIENLD